MTTGVTETGGHRINHSNKAIYSPFLRDRIKKYCLNTSLTSIYTKKETSFLIGTSTDSHNLTQTVESINESKTVPAGTFTTVRIKSQTNNLVSTTWLDIKTGLGVALENRNQMIELISYSINEK